MYNLLEYKNKIKILFEVGFFSIFFLFIFIFLNELSFFDISNLRNLIVENFQFSIISFFIIIGLLNMFGILSMGSTIIFSQIIFQPYPALIISLIILLTTTNIAYFLGLGLKNEKKYWFLKVHNKLLKKIIKHMEFKIKNIPLKIFFTNSFFSSYILICYVCGFFKKDISFKKFTVYNLSMIFFSVLIFSLFGELLLTNFFGIIFVFIILIIYKYLKHKHIKKLKVMKK